METRQTDRYEFLDALRGVAAFDVLINHVLRLGVPTVGIPLTTDFSMGGFGVLLFFLVSGFIIPVSIERGGSLWRFWSGRFWRLYPLYLAVLIAAVPLALVAYPHTYLLPPVAVRADFALLFAANLLPLQVWADLPVAMSPFWTLSFEVAFYALASLAWLAGLYRRPALIALASLGLALAVEGGCLHLTGMTLARPGTLVYFGCFFAGTVAHGWIKGQVSGCSLAAVGLLAAAVSVATLPASMAGEILGRLSAIAVFGLALALRRAPMPRVLLWLGQISYSLYLTHILVVSAVPRTGLAWIDMGIWVVLALLLASATERTIERPGRRCGRWLASRRAHSCNQLIRLTTDPVVAVARAKKPT